jgi:uncharacterized protein YecE (DUF72 family)
MACAYIGTSGFSYPEWKPSFYPAKLPQKGFLAHYASRLSAVEIDSTFYRFPRPTTLDAWRGATGPGFRFALKAPQKITHRERLVAGSDAVAYWASLLPRLGDRLGIVLYQLPPFLKRDDERLAAFIAALPPGAPVAFEFRHASWFCSEIYALLRRHEAALCIRDADDETTPLEITARCTYLRLRRAVYGPDGRRFWRERIDDWTARDIEVFAFVKHEGDPPAPWIALELASEAGSVDR